MNDKRMEHVQTLSELIERSEYEVDPGEVATAILEVLLGVRQLAVEPQPA